MNENITCDKVEYSTYEQARIAAVSLSSLHKYSYKVYKCVEGDHWHISSGKKKLKKVKDSWSCKTEDLSVEVSINGKKVKRNYHLRIKC